MANRDRILIVSPHPDDETLGCGGTILKHVRTGNEVYWLIMTNIFSGEQYSQKQVEIRQEEIIMVAKEYRFKGTFKLDFPASKLDIVPKAEIVKKVRQVISRVSPKLVYIPYKNDTHSDHGVTFDAVISAAKAFRSESITRILAYEVISETEFAPPLKDNTFMPNSFSDISGYIEQKIKIMRIYKSEIANHPFPRSVKNIKALATFRGATAKVKYAESFMILKEIW